MPLICQLFTKPTTDPRLEGCLVDDAKHVKQSDRGPFVSKIQTALNLLNAGAPNAGIPLKVDGWYGPKTAAAVKKYKDAPQRRIMQPWQTTADDIVGKRTIESLDTEMDVLENTLPEDDGLISSTPAGSEHDHSKCPTPPRVSGRLFQGHADHLALPINPKGTGLMINIYGEGETDYLKFKDYGTELQFTGRRPLTRTLPSNRASDICMRSAPINHLTAGEIKRLARPQSEGGCRFTYASNIGVFASPSPFILGLGRVVQQARVSTGPNTESKDDFEVWVIEITK